MDHRSMRWLNDRTLDIGDVQFDLDPSPSSLAKVSTKERFVLLKAPPMINELVELLKNESVRHVVEIGSSKGGSCALYHRLFQPEKLVAIDINPQPKPALDDYTRHHRFMALFPYLRPGGYYLIEDWGWAHCSDDSWQTRKNWANRPALTNLIVEIIMLSASRPDLVSQVTINHHTAICRRGAGRIEPGTFVLERLYLARGWKWRPII